MYWKFNLTVAPDICGTCSLYFFPQINNTTFKSSLDAGCL
jgi:hypothetical protein